MKEFQILLFYKYTNIEDPEQLMHEQRELCNWLGLKGRIIVATEGINATVEGEKDKTEEYVEKLLSDPRFADTHIKRSKGDGDSFPKLSVKVRPELVSAHLDEQDIDPNVMTGKHITPEELHGWFENDEEFYIIDMRNDYEFKVGHFKNSILPSLTNFRDLPEIIPEIEHLKDKKVLTVCTGGVRCEKASGYLVSRGFKNVHQLYGGIVSYMEAYPNQNYLGKLYVFDKRIIMGFNTDSPEHVVIGKCDKCGAESEAYTNCAYDFCHKHMIACEDCTDSNGNVFCDWRCKLNAVVLEAIPKEYRKPYLQFRGILK